MLVRSILLLLFVASSLFPCTNFLITKGATVDGSTMISYAADSHEFYGFLDHIPAADHLPGEMRDIYEWDTGKYLGQIPEVPHTFAVIGNMSEHQVSVGETTYGGRKELEGSGLVDYGSLMFIAMQRAKTAREAIKVMGEIVVKYGYASEGETFSIADPNEVWIMDMIGKGKDDRGAVWVARKIPDGTISAHANQARIRTFPLHDPDTCLYAPDVISFARKMGYFKGKDEAFSFVDAYAPPDYGALRFCEIRVWAMFNRVAPSLHLSSDYVKGIKGAKPVPLWVKPDKKLSARDIMALMRDHFEGTEFDMSKDIGAGPYHLPYRWRPLTWKVDGKEYLNERATSTQQTGFSFVAQARSWLPDPIGGTFWFGVDDTNSTVYIPIYCGIERVPPSYSGKNGDLYHFSFKSAFWTFNAVANFAYSRYSDIIKDIQVLQRRFEGGFFTRRGEIEAAAMKLYAQSPRLAKDYLTDYSVNAAEGVVERWRKLWEELLVKYMDGNVKTPTHKVTHPGYPEDWYQRIVKDTGDKLEMKKVK